MRTVKEILMARDLMEADDADELIADFKDELEYTLSVEDQIGACDTLASAEQLLKDYFGLEPDYLMEFID